MTIMSYSISTLLTRTLSDVFGEKNPARRRAALDELWTEDGVFYDPNSRGRDEIDRIAGAIKATHPDFRYEPIAGPEELGNGGRRHRATRAVNGRSRSRQGGLLHGKLAPRRERRNDDLDGNEDAVHRPRLSI
jgi:hypothetical protein